MNEDEERRVLALPVAMRPRGCIQTKEEIIIVTEAIDQIRNSRRSAEVCKSTMESINGNLNKLVRKQSGVKNTDPFPLTVPDFQKSKIGKSFGELLQKSWVAY